MTALLRNALLAAIAVSAVAGSALAGQQTVITCDKTLTGKDWTGGRCCSSGDSSCMGGGNGHQGHESKGRQKG